MRIGLVAFLVGLVVIVVGAQISGSWDHCPRYTYCIDMGFLVSVSGVVVLAAGCVLIALVAWKYQL